eukprot:3838818-Pyramimonas_sp.AAC.1
MTPRRSLPTEDAHSPWHRSSTRPPRWPPPSQIVGDTWPLETSWPDPQAGHACVPRCTTFRPEPWPGED